MGGKVQAKQVQAKKVDILLFYFILFIILFCYTITMAKKTMRLKKPHKWSRKYKLSINCKRPHGFSQRQYCKYGRRKTRRQRN